MKRSATTTITFVALTALAACAIPAEGKLTKVTRYLDTHTREEFHAMMEAKTGATTSTRSERGRSLSAYAYCEGYSEGDWNQHCGTYTNSWGYTSYEYCDADDRAHRSTSGDSYHPGQCVRYCDRQSDCDAGTFCGHKYYNTHSYGVCLTCAEYNPDWTWDRQPNSNCDIRCTSDSSCPSDTYCAETGYHPASDSSEAGRCATCHNCFNHNSYTGSCTACTTFLNAHANANNFRSSDYRGDAEDFTLTNLPSDCWRDAASAGYDELYTGDCGAFGEETELWCDGFCISDSWLDCCDPKAGAIAALTMGCFFAAVGALFTAAWIFKCWCFKKPNALMLQAMANQQQQRAMAAGQMQSPVVVQMQAAAPARK